MSTGSGAAAGGVHGARLQEEVMLMSFSRTARPPALPYRCRLTLVTSFFCGDGALSTSGRLRCRSYSSCICLIMGCRLLFESSVHGARFQEEVKIIPRKFPGGRGWGFHSSRRSVLRIKFSIISALWSNLGQSSTRTALEFISRIRSSSQRFHAGRTHQVQALQVVIYRRS